MKSLIVIAAVLGLFALPVAHSEEPLPSCQPVPLEQPVGAIPTEAPSTAGNRQ